jgi:uncharacterized coiled-coil DUF342 family protein
MSILNDLTNIKEDKITNAKIEKHRAEMEATKRELAEAERELEQLQHKHTRATNSLSAQARKKRDHRLIQRGAIVESFIENAEALTNDEVKAVLTRVFRAAN